MKHISVCIPTYEMGGRGAVFLKHSLDILAQQTFKDFEIVISDHSEDNQIQDLCDQYVNRLDIRYVKNSENRGNSSANVNNAIKKATGRLIKILFQDDFLYHSHALEDIAGAFDLEKDGWLVTACIHTRDGVSFFRPFNPHYDDATILAKNTISSPSVVTIRNEDPVFFDEKLIWWMDLDYYKRCYGRFGSPRIVNSINVVNRIGEHQMTNTAATEQRRENEFRYILGKYQVKNARRLMVVYKARKYKRIVKSAAKKLFRMKAS